MASGWTDSETRALLGVWSEEKIQDQLNKVNKKKPIFDAIAAKLSEFGYMKTGEQCKTKIKNLWAKYRKVKDSNRTSGSGADNSFPFFDEMDAVLGTRATFEPPILVDCGLPDGAVSLDDSENGGSSVNTGELGDSSLETSQLESTMSSGLSSIQDMPGPSGNSASSTMNDGEKARSIRNKRKRKCHDDNLELFHLLSEMDEAAEKQQAEFETKQLKLLADLQQTSRQKEHAHEERVMAMMMSMMQQTTALLAGQPPVPLNPSAGRMPPGPFFPNTMYRSPSYYPPSDSDPQ